jgi:hypothetical protein
VLSVFSLSDQLGAFTIPLAILGAGGLIALAIYQAMRGIDLEITDERRSDGDD